jgi:hypothetical protein
MHRIFKKQRDLAAWASRSRRPHRQKLGFEALEDRQLLTLGLPFLVNTKTSNAQEHSANATAANGMSVVVWQDQFSTTHVDNDIYAQMYNADGTARGPQITVDFSNLDERHPAVAMDSNGNFVVVYEETEPDGHSDVVAKRYSNTGAQIGDRVANVVVGDNKNAHNPSVAMDRNGNFVVTYTVDFNSTFPFDKDLRARMFDSSGNFVKAPTFGATTGTDDESEASVAMDHLGDFVIAYTRQNHATTDMEIDVAQFTTGGNLIATNAIGNRFDRVSAPSVAMDDFSNVVVAYDFNHLSHNGGLSEIGAQRFLFGGIAFGSGILITDNTGTISRPTVALQPIGGSPGPFVVAYNVAANSNNIGLPDAGAEVTYVNSSFNGNTIADREETLFADKSDQAAVSIDSNGHLLVTFTAVNPSNGDRDIHGERDHLTLGPAAKNLALTPTIQAGQSATLTGSLTDSAGNANLTLTVNWGDGSQPQQSRPGLKPFAVAHKYTVAGKYTVHVTWSDNDGRSNSRDLFITVNPAPAGR